jgi:mannose-6-phosphate isomerase-like protein (cupin superfamily)
MTEPDAMSAFDELAAIRPLGIWKGILARAVHGDELTLAVVELDPQSVVAEHSHPNEQLGIVLRGSVVFRVGSESRELGPGGTWCIPANAPQRPYRSRRRSSTSSRHLEPTGKRRKASSGNRRSGHDVRFGRK